MSIKLARFATSGEADAFAAGIILVNDPSIEVILLYKDDHSERPYVAKIKDTDEDSINDTPEFIEIEYGYLWVDYSKTKPEDNSQVNQTIQARWDKAHKRAYALATDEVNKAQIKFEAGDIEIEEFESIISSAEIKKDKQNAPT